MPKFSGASKRGLPVCPETKERWKYWYLAVMFPTASGTLPEWWNPVIALRADFHTLSNQFIHSLIHPASVLDACYGQHISSLLLEGIQLPE